VLCWTTKAHDALVQALNAANCSYCPYTHCPSGVALLAKDGAIYCGGCIESCAYNPSISPLQVAVIALIIKGGDIDSITHAVLVERENNLPGFISQEVCSKAVLKGLAPKVQLQVVQMHAQLRDADAHSHQDPKDPTDPIVGGTEEYLTPLPTDCVPTEQPDTHLSLASTTSLPPPPQERAVKLEKQITATQSPKRKKLEIEEHQVKSVSRHCFKS